MTFFRGVQTILLGGCLILASVGCKSTYQTSPQSAQGSSAQGGSPTPSAPATSAPPTPALTPTPVTTPNQTVSPTPTDSSTASPSQTPTPFLTPTCTSTLTLILPSYTPSSTQPAATSSPTTTLAATGFPSPNATNPWMSMGTATATPTPTDTPSATLTSTPSSTATSSPTPVATSTSTPTSTVAPFHWVEATAASPMGARMFSGDLVFNNRMWIIAGGSPCVQEGLFKSDVWSSTNGAAWTRASAAAAFGIREAMGCVVFNPATGSGTDGRMWLIGGDDFQYLYNDVWSSTDGAAWTRATAAAPFTGRDHFGCVAFNGRMWVIGGDENFGLNAKSDVWSSADGVNWTLEGNLPGPRAAFGCVVFNGAIWVVGGHNGATSPNSSYYSTDGSHWSEAVPNTGGPGSPGGWQRSYASARVFNGKIWLVNGTYAYDWDRTSACDNDLWVSSDGFNWTLQSPSLPFMPRFASESFVYNNSFWMVEGAWYSSYGQSWAGPTGVVTTMTGADYLKDIWHTQ